MKKTKKQKVTLSQKENKVLLLMKKITSNGVSCRHCSSCGGCSSCGSDFK